MKNLILSCSAFAFMVAGFGMANTASAYDQAHLNQLARKIERQANRLITETVHYRHTEHYQEMIVETIRLRNAARHVRSITFCSRTFAHLERDLAALDASFHELEEFFDHVELDSANGHGHIHGNTAHVKVILNNMEDTIHHMQDDVKFLRRDLFGNGPRVIVSPRPIYESAPIYRAPVYRAPYSGHSSGRGADYCPSTRRSSYGGHGLSINRGGFSLRIKL